MKLKLNLIMLFAILIIAFSNGGNLYAQESSDTAEAPEAAGTDYIEPGDDELASLLTEQPNPYAVVRPLIQTSGTTVDELFIASITSSKTNIPQNEIFTVTVNMSRLIL